ncbi:hypothetical protein HYH03_004128 [Edaphochlamys debaryana]|uniref:RAP domain-containing protein n=1 Tax=Edaphochlamys debaryana TaxID=47281 RepID=A0A836C3J8_9CHLO|nr:hypothetical protein HYH03_004128 [Edaphochlamys debaryana]|eukprot:KAG2497862.1 hypothetical protein HYH03_004128 [Edaphochlamys debaryana]
MAVSLKELADMVERDAASWAASGDVSRLCEAFKTASVRDVWARDPHSSPAWTQPLRRRTLALLAEAYLPLVTSLEDPAHCLGPLWACAKAGFWEGSLPRALLTRLGADGGVLLVAASAKEHANLWWALSSAPPWAQLLTVQARNELLRSSAMCLDELTADELGPQACANILLACARLQLRSDPLLGRLTACLLEVARRADAQHLANAWYALGELAEDRGYAPALDELQRLAAHVLQRLPEHVPAVPAAAGHVAGGIGSRPGEAGAGSGTGARPGSAFSTGVGSGGAFTDQALSNMLLACVKLRFADRTFLHRLTAHLAARPGPSHQVLANAWYALGKLAEAPYSHGSNRASLHRLAAAIQDRLQPESGKQAQAGGAAAGPDASQPEQGRGGGAAGSRQEQAAGGSGGWRGRFKDQELSNMLLGCAKLGWRSKLLLRRLAAATGRAAPHMASQGIANSLYSLGVLGCTGPSYDTVLRQLIEALNGSLARAPDSWAPQGLSMSLWALEKLRPGEAQAATEAIAAECSRRRYEGFKPVELCTAVWALAKLGCQHQGYVAAAVEAALRAADAMPGATAQDWANLWSALAHCRHRPAQELLHRTSAALRGLRVGTCAIGAHECTDLLRSLAVLRLYDEPLVELLTRRLAEILARRLEEGGPGSEVDGHDLCNGLWALAVMGPDVLSSHSGLVEGLLREVMRQWGRAQAQRKAAAKAGAASAAPAATAPASPSPDAAKAAPDAPSIAAHTGAGEDAHAPFGRTGLQQLWQVQLELEHLAADSDAGSDGDDHSRRRKARSAPPSDRASSPATRNRSSSGSDGAGAHEARAGLAGLARVLVGGDGSLLAAMRPAAEGGDPTTSVLQRQVVAALWELRHQLAAAAQRHAQPHAPSHGPAASAHAQHQHAPGGAASVAGGGGGGGGAGGSRRGRRALTILAIRQEHPVLALGCRVDVVLELSGGRRVAVEVDGPWHYMANGQHLQAETGGTVMRNRQLRRIFGATNLVVVPFYEFRALASLEEEVAYLRRVLGLGLGPGRAGRRVST